MKSAEEIAGDRAFLQKIQREIIKRASSQCVVAYKPGQHVMTADWYWSGVISEVMQEMLPAAIRAAQIDAAEWMREEAAKVITDNCHDDMTRDEEAAAVRAIKLPGDGE